MTLEVVEDQKVFDRHQDELLRQLIVTIRDSIDQAGASIPEEDIYSLVSVISFNISALLDGSTVAGSPDNPAVPYLAFRKEEQSDTLIASGVGSYLHEISEGLVDDVFDNATRTDTGAIDHAAVSEGLDGDCQFFLKSHAGDIEVWLFPEADTEDALDAFLGALGENIEVGRAFAEPFIEAIESVEMIRHQEGKASEKKILGEWEEMRAAGVDGLCKLLTQTVN